MISTEKDVTVIAPVNRPLSALAAIVFGAMLTIFAGGCTTGEELTLINNEADFQKLVIESKQPVIVEFSKDQCPTCVILEPELVKVSQEYAGRAKFYKFMLLNRFFQPYSPLISDTYKLQLVPTAVLFVDGQEKQRWFMDYFGDTYRKALNELVGPPAEPKPQ
jgi:thioredoxin 1